MKSLEYHFSIPNYLLSKLYYKTFLRKFGPIFPALRFIQKHDGVQRPLLKKSWVKLSPLYSGICGSDLNLLTCHESFSMEPYASFPCVLGHENVAQVLDAPQELKNRGIKTGDLVVVNPVMSCRVREVELCDSCIKGKEALCERFGEESLGGLSQGMSLGYHRDTGGGWSSEFQAHHSQIYPLKGITSKESAKVFVLTDPLSSVLQPICDAFMRLSSEEQKKERHVLIFGAGTVGLLALFAIKALKLPWKVTLGYRYQFQAEIAKSLGADQMISTSGKFLDKISQLHGFALRSVSIGPSAMEGGFDFIFDCVGSDQTLDLSLRMTRARGEVVLVATANSLKNVDPTPIWFREVRLFGTCMSDQVRDPRNQQMISTYELAIQLIKTSDHSVLQKCITHTYALKDYKLALKTALSKKRHQSVKVIFDLTKD